MVRLIILLGFGAFSPEFGQVFAQSDLLELGRQALKEKRYEDALQEFERVLSEYPELSDAHFLIFRVYSETPLFDEDQAKESLEKALEIEPENVEYLVARLEQYKIKSWGLLGDRLREARRLGIARKILKINPDNAEAHEELGKAYIRDFWRYRNAIMLPSVSYGYAGSARAPDSPDYSEIESTLENNILDGTASFPNIPELNPNEVFLGDQFDLDKLISQGVDVLDLSGRAETAYLHAMDHFNKILDVDPGKRSVYDELMKIHTLKGEYADAAGTLNLMYKYYPEDPDLWSYLGIVHYKLGNMGAADRAFDRAFELMSEGQKRAYENLELFLTDQEKDLEKINPMAYRAQFWAGQDPRLLSPYNERKLEHYFRVTYADLFYGSDGLDLRGWETERGQILIRYGQPKSDIVLHPREDGVFSARNALVGAIVKSVTQGSQATTESISRTMGEKQAFSTVFSTAREAFEQMNVYNIWEYGEFRFVFEDPFRNGEYRMYSPPADEISRRANSYLNDYVRITNEFIRDTPQRYEYTAFERQIELPFLVNSFKGVGQQSHLAVSYGIPIEFSFDPSTEMIEVNGTTGIFLVDHQRDMLVDRRRSIYGLATNQIVSFAEQFLWLDTQEIKVPHGTHEFSLEFETSSGQTVAVQQREINIPNYHQSGLILSDIMLAYSVEEIEDGRPLSDSEIVRDGLSILPVPWSVYSTEQPVYLYFEVYGLSRNFEGNTDYSIEITLDPQNTGQGVRHVARRLFRRGQKGVLSVSYERSGFRTDESIYQILDVRQQEAGRYSLALRVKDRLTGRSVERSHDLFLE